MLLQPSDYLGIQLRPAWATINGNAVTDCDLSVLLGRRYLFFRVGYRWVKNELQTLEGPYGGISLRY